MNPMRHDGLMRATWNGQVIAESDETIEIEGNQYFPPDSVKREHFQDSDQHTDCPWKGRASYYTVDVDGEQVENGAWYYPEPKDAVGEIKDYVAFYPQVQVN
jgi:uncharacterized protein (DUF427 family)